MLIHAVGDLATIDTEENTGINSFTKPEKECQFQSGNIMDTMEVVLEHGDTFK